MPKRNTRITTEEKDKALESYRKYGNLSACAVAAGVTRQCIWEEKTRNKTFKRQLEEAFEEYCEKWEFILEKRAQGEKADLLLMFKMKAMMPDKYRERIDHKVDTNIRVISAIPRPQTTPLLTNNTLKLKDKNTTPAPTK